MHRRHPALATAAAAAAGALACAAALCLAPRAARAELSDVWALDDGTKVKATARAHPLRKRNAVWRDGKLRLIAARNEIVAFQVILVGGKRRTRGVRVALDRVGAIRNAKNLASGRGKSADRWFIGRRIELFRQHYLRIKTRSFDLAWKKNSAAMPSGLSGWVPDALVPLRRGDSFSVPARRSQGVWVDLYVPKTARAGVHRGTLVVSVGGKPCKLARCRIPVALDVAPVTLPDRPTLETMLWFSAGDGDRDHMMARYFKRPWKASAAAVRALRARHYKLARRHRVTLFLGKRKKPDAAVAARLSGRAFSRAAGYEGPGMGVGQDLYSIHTYGGKLTRAEAKRWSRFLRRYKGVTHFLYVGDEPSAGDYPKLNKVARAARPVPSFITTRYTPKLSAVSIFCALPDDYKTSDQRRARRAGKRQWIYNGVRPFSGSFATDDVAVATRVNAWIQYKHRIERWFFWDSVYYKDFQGKRGNVDVWRQPINFTNRHGDRMNGDGLLFYPGRDFVFPKQDRRFDMPLPSIRLKNWRRGLQDADYLALAKRAGHGRAVSKLLERVLPRTLDQARRGARVAWSESGDKWFAARKRLWMLLKRRK